jgi:methylphosphotriester-DNA--protein-cysteine methyltransferase
MRNTLKHFTKTYLLGAILCLSIAAQERTIPGSSHIIGDKSSKEYHRPDCPGYSKVSDRNRVYFNSEAQAKKAGYKLAENCSRRLR